MSLNRLLLRHFRPTRLTCSVLGPEMSHNYVSNCLGPAGGSGTHSHTFTSTELLMYSYHEDMGEDDAMHVAGYLAAAERIADGDADSPDDGELWAPTDLTPENRARWIEGFRSHFEP